MNQDIEKKRQGKRKQHLVLTMAALVSVVLLVVILGKGLTLDPNTKGNALAGKVAIDFHAKWLQGQGLVKEADPSGFRLSQFKGQPVVLNFWASWCVSCREEAREMELFWQKYKDKGVAVVGIAIQDQVEPAMQFANYFQKSYILGIDSQGGISLDYGVTGVPETFFIDSNGVVKEKVVGPVSFSMMESVVQKLLQSQGSQTSNQGG